MLIFSLVGCGKTQADIVDNPAIEDNAVTEAPSATVDEETDNEALDAIEEASTNDEVNTESNNEANAENNDVANAEENKFSKITDEEIIESFDLYNISNDEYNKLIEWFISTEEIDLVNRLVALRAPSSNIVIPSTPSIGKYEKLLKDNFNYNPMDGDADLDSFWAELAKCKTMEERATLGAYVYKYMHDEYDWKAYFDNLSGEKKTYSEYELSQMVSTKEAVESISDDVLKTLSEEDLDILCSNILMYYNDSNLSDKLRERWDKIDSGNWDINGIEYTKDEEGNFIVTGNYSIDANRKYLYTSMISDISVSTYPTKYTIWSDVYSHGPGQYKQRPDGKIGNIDRGVPDNTEYTKEEFSNRIKELFFENTNAMREVLEIGCDGTELKAYLKGDEWTNAFADQRAFERIHNNNNSPWQGYVHDRPLSAAKYTKTKDGYKWPVLTPAQLDTKEIQYVTYNGFWPNEYHKYQKGENLAATVSFDKNEFKYTEYYAKQIADYSFWGLWSSSGHLEALISPNYNHCAIGVYENEEKTKMWALPDDEVIYQIVNLFYSLDSEQCNYLHFESEWFG